MRVLHVQDKTYQQYRLELIMIDMNALANEIKYKSLQNKRNFKNDCLCEVLNDKEEVALALELCYKNEVTIRGGEYRKDSELEDTLNRVAGWLVNPDTKPWLLMYGPLGNGKTTILRAIQTLINSQKIRYGCYHTSLKVYSAIKIADIARANREVFDEIKTTHALGVDDIGTESLEVNDFGTRLSPMVELMLQRYDSRKMTLFTSNLGAEDIAHRYKERVGDRMNEILDLLYIGTPSYR